MAPGSPGQRSLFAQQLLREASLELARLRRIRGASHKTWRRIARAQARLALAAALLAAAPGAEPAAAATPNFQHGLILDAGPFYTSQPTFADIDGDGDLDLFVGEQVHGSTIFFENTGTDSAPALAAPSTNPFGLTNVVLAAPALVDIDGDGDLDVFAGEHFYGSTIFFENTGTSSALALAAPSTNPFGLSSVGELPEFADIDGDGDPDAFFLQITGDTVFFENTGTVSAPAFGAPSTNPFGLADVGFRGSGLALVDIDGDGDLDVFAGRDDTSGVARLLFFENTGTSTSPAFAAPATNPFPFGLLVGLSSVERLPSPAFADLDGDGDFDALMGSYYAPLVVFENTGTATTPAFISSGNPFGLSGSFRVSPALGDLDGDGNLDALVGDAYGRTFFFRNTGSATAPAFAFVASNPFGLVSISGRSTPAFADIDGDGDLDVFSATSFFRNTGTLSSPAFAAPVTGAFGLVAAVPALSAASPAFADIDADGDLDAFIGNDAGNTLFFRNTGTAVAPAFAVPQTNPSGLADVGSYASPELADVDGDGDLDASIGNLAGNTIFFRNTGTAMAPAFAAPQTNPFGLADVGYFASPISADIDGDGDLDVFVGENFRGRLFFFENVLIDPEACNDGLDNDGDGRVDLGDDPGCASAADASELSSRQCDNGIDDDGDGKIDWRGDGTGDPNCAGLRDNKEARRRRGATAGLGPELLLLAPLLAARRRMRGRDG